MLTIQLNHLQFRAFHGVYEEEKINGNDFEVNVLIHYQEPEKIINQLSETIDYQKVFELINNRMAIPTELLETLVMEIAQAILAQFLLAEVVFISIQKLHPPIPQLKGSVGVSYECHRH
ncbi:MAG: dihydroneopterin aldolase [Chitinophagaceae bacterium]